MYNGIHGYCVFIETPPLTPLANLKVLIAAASSARENESGESTGCGFQELVPMAPMLDVKCEEDKGAEEGGGRKMRSLAILCKKSVYLNSHTVITDN